jgi:hypothetical protein
MGKCCHNLHKLSRLFRWVTLSYSNSSHKFSCLFHGVTLIELSTLSLGWEKKNYRDYNGKRYNDCPYNMDIALTWLCDNQRFACGL